MSIASKTFLATSDLNGKTDCAPCTRIRTIINVNPDRQLDLNVNPTGRNVQTSIIPTLKETWETSLANELGRLSQGTQDIKGTGTFTFIRKSEVPKDHLNDVTCGRIVVSYRLEKKEKIRTRLTAGRDKINYPFETSAPTCGLPVNKLHFNSVLSTPGAMYATIDVFDFYLGTKLKRSEITSTSSGSVLEALTNLAEPSVISSVAQ